MPGKTRRQKTSKNPRRSKKRPVAAVRQAEVAQARETIPVPVTQAPTAATAKPAAAPHPYIVRELWTIGILAVLMLAILIILSSVLS
jgi:hypothetical protein